MDPAGSISCVEEDEKLARRPDIRCVLRPWPAEGREREGVRSGDGGHERIMSREESSREAGKLCCAHFGSSREKKVYMTRLFLQ